MTERRSWRESASPEAQADLDGLLDIVLRFAEQTLAKHGEMHPYGAAVSVDGEVRMIAVDPGAATSSGAVLDALYEAGRGMAGETRAIAFVSDVLADGADAVRVEAEHREGVALVVAVPYKRARLRKNVTFGAMRLMAGERRVWPA